MKDRKKIGILYPNKVFRDYEVNSAYVMLFKKFGETVAITPEDAFRNDIDLLVTTGGADINPLMYGQFPDDNLGYPNLHYDYFDLTMLDKYIDADIPIVGICRGLQSMYVNKGGQLHQHVNLPSSVSSSKKRKNLFNQHIEKGTRDRVVEFLSFTNEFKYLNKYYNGINSLHHQTVDLSTLPDSIIPIAYSKEHGNLEILKVKNKNIVCFQYHPEELINNHLSEHLIKLALYGKLANRN